PGRERPPPLARRVAPPPFRGSLTSWLQRAASRRRARATACTIHIGNWATSSLGVPVDAAIEQVGCQCFSKSAYMASATACNPGSRDGIRYTERDLAQELNMPKPVAIPP